MRRASLLDVRTRRLCATLGAALCSCAPGPIPARPAPPPPRVVRAAPASAPRPRPAPVERAFYLRPNDFHDGELTLNLFTGPEHRTLIVVVPALTAASLKRGRVIPMIAHAAAAGPGAEPTLGHALPKLEKLPFTPARVPPPAPAHLARSRRFSVRAWESGTYSDVVGQLAYAGDRYAFYREPANHHPFTRAEYAEINKELDTHYSELVGIFGPVTDLDGNGRIAVLVSRTVGIRNSGEGSVDDCNFEPHNPHCKPGEVIYLVSPDEVGRQRSELVQDFYSRTILHETIHLCQRAAAYNAGKQQGLYQTPELYKEGPAELFRYKDNLGEREKWDKIHRAFQLGGVTGTPAAQVYPLGGLLFWWADVAFGDGIQRALLNAELDGNGDPFEATVHVPEPLVLAMMYAALELDGTPLGTRSHLDFPDHDVAKLGGTPPVQPLELGHNAGGAASWTGATTFEARHAEPWRVKLDVAGAGAYVLVAEL